MKAFAFVILNLWIPHVFSIFFPLQENAKANSLVSVHIFHAVIMSFIKLSWKPFVSVFVSAFIQRTCFGADIDAFEACMPMVADVRKCGVLLCGVRLSAVGLYSIVSDVMNIHGFQVSFNDFVRNFVNRAKNMLFLGYLIDTQVTEVVTASCISEKPRKRNGSTVYYNTQAAITRKTPTWNQHLTCACMNSSAIITRILTPYTHNIEQKKS